VAINASVAATATTVSSGTISVPILIIPLELLQVHLMSLVFPVQLRDKRKL
jgi:hypothetical protein